MFKTLNYHHKIPNSLSISLNKRKHMPHIIIETSESLIEKHDPQALCDAVHQAAVDTGIFAESPGGIKVRLNAFKYYNNNFTKDDFLHVFANIMEGRTPMQKANLSLGITKALKDNCPEVEIISTQIIDIDKASYSNKAMV